MGHGMSEGERYYVEKFEDYVNDLEYFTKKTIFVYKKQGMNPPVFLFGHSMGAAISTMLAYRNQSLYKGVYLSSPMFGIPQFLENPISIFMGRLLSTFLPKLLLPVLFVNNNEISHDREVIEAYIKDPLISNKQIFMRTANELQLAVMKISEISKNISFPFHISAGEEDTITPVRGSKIFYENAKSKHKSLRIYKGSKHEILHGKGSRIVRNDLYDWIVS